MIKNLINPRNTAILVIDIQNDYCSSKGKLALLKNFDITPIEKIIPHISNFLEQARNHKIPIIWTRMIEDPKYMAPNAARKIRSGKTGALCTPGTWGFDYYKIKPEKVDFEIVKKSYDAFSNPKLQKILKMKKIKNLIIFGMYTAVCVDSTVRGAFREGYNVIVPKDLVAMVKEKLHLHELILENMDENFAYVTNSKEIISKWRVK